MSTLLVSFYDWLTANPEAFEQGSGLFSTLHICLMVFLAVWLVSMFFLFKKFPKFTKYAILGMSIYIITARIFRMVLCVSLGINTWLEVMPFHLCHIMSFLLPICIFFNWKKPLPAFLLYAFFGGVLTFIFGNYYKYSILTFFDIESIILHTLLPTIAVAFVAIKQIKMTILDMVVIPIMLVCLAGWAWVGNTLLPDANFMYIKYNGLPFNMFPGHHFLWTYFVLMVIALASIYIPVLIIRRREKVKIKINLCEPLKDGIGEDTKIEKNSDKIEISKPINTKISNKQSQEKKTVKKNTVRKTNAKNLKSNDIIKNKRTSTKKSVVTDKRKLSVNKPENNPIIGQKRVVKSKEKKGGKTK